MKKLTRHFSSIIVALLIGSAVTCVAGIYGLSRLDRSFETIVTTDMPRLMTITDLRRRIRSLVVLERDHILEANEEKARGIAADIAKGRKAAEETFARYEPYLLPENAAQFRALRADFDAWTELDERVLAASAVHRTEEASALSKRHSKQWEALIKELIETADKRLAGKATQTRGVFVTARTTVLLVFVVSALLGLVAGVFIYRGIRRTVNEVVMLKDRLVAANESLERTVEERTRTIRAILDHVTFGFFLVRRDLCITEGYTRSLAALLGTSRLAGRRVSECLGLEGGRADDFDLQVGQIFDDVLPEELSCDQVPSRIVREGRVLRVQASAVRDHAGEIVQILFGVSDVTDLEAAERANRDSQTVLRALKNPEPFRRFVADLNARFGWVREAVENADEPRARRELHTIKGNASCHGLVDLAKRAHELEEQPSIELPPLLDLEYELEAFLNNHLEILGIDRKGAEREVYRLDGGELDWMEAQIAHATDLEKLRQGLSARLRRLRWQPAKRLLGPLEVSVANLSERLGKDVALQIVGGDTSVLPARVMPIVAVLPHLVRNAIDHGIEERDARGAKPAQGTLKLSFEDCGDTWRIAVADDGRGVDTDKLRARAVARGLVAADDRPSHEQLCALIFEPKLSTADEVSEISGRGEGLAAVAAAVKAADGSVVVRSTRGLGTTIVMEIPKQELAHAA